MKGNTGSARLGALLLAAVLLLAYISASASPAAQVIGTVTITNPQYVNVRSGGGTSYEVIAQVQPGSVYPCVGIAASGWYAILLDDGRTGYVERSAKVSSTCLVAVARNRYSVPCELAGSA